MVQTRKAAIIQISSRRRPKRRLIQANSGVKMAEATRKEVRTQAASSAVADITPRISGSATAVEKVSIPCIAAAVVIAKAMSRRRPGVIGSSARAAAVLTGA